MLDLEEHQAVRSQMVFRGGQAYRRPPHLDARESYHVSQLTVEEHQLDKDLTEWVSVGNKKKVLEAMVRDDTYYAECKKWKAMQVDQIQKVRQRLQDVEKRVQYFKELDAWTLECEYGLELIGQFRQRQPREGEERVHEQLNLRSVLNTGHAHLSQAVEEYTGARGVSLVDSMVLDERVYAKHKMRWERMEGRSHSRMIEKIGDLLHIVENFPLATEGAQKTSTYEQELADELQDMESNWLERIKL